MPLERSRPIVSVPTLAQATGLSLRSLPPSTGVHIVVIAAFLLLGLAPRTGDAPHHLRHISHVDLKPEEQLKAPILPVLQSSSSSGSSPASASSASAPGRNASSSASSMSFLHTGPQHIISNTPDATNSVQTILQPDVPHPPRLAHALPIPSMVRMASAQHAPSLSAPTLTAIARPAAPPAPAPVPQPTPPKIQPAHLDTVPLTSATELADAPKLAAFATTGHSYNPPRPPPPTPSAAKPSAPTAAKSAPSPPSNTTSATGTDRRNLLVVNAIEVQSTLSERDIPAAEIHGRFEVAASPNLDEAHSTGGLSSTAGVGDAGLAASGSGAGKGNSGSASGAGSGGGHGKGSGRGNSDVAGTGSGHGVGVGTGAGAGSGHGTGMGNGNGSAPAGGNGSAPFSGMTIVGGSGGANSVRTSPNVDAGINVNDPHGYNMTIASSGGSGGALSDFGVFNGGPAYTVYIDVSKLGIRGMRWSLQYGASREIRFAHPGVPLTAPFPSDERLPQLPPEVVAANVGRLVVVQANLNADGKLDGFHVVQSPDQRLNDGLIDSLTHWYFEPAAMGSDKVSVKVLLGIPIAPAMAADPSLSQQADRHIPAAPRSSAQ